MFTASPYGWVSQYLFGFFFSYGVYLPFWALWFESQGVSAAHIGTLIGLGFAARCLANVFLTPRIHKVEHLVPALRWFALATLIFGSLYFVAGGDFWLLAVITVLFNITMGPMMPLPDSMANYYAKHQLLDYGSTRVWGSIAFIVGSTAVGYLAANWGHQWILFSCLGGLAANFILSLRTPNPAPKTEGEFLTRPRPKLLALLREWSIVKFLLLEALIQGSHAAYYSIGSIYWKQAGYSEETIGYLWSLGVLMEVMLFAFSRRWFAHVPVKTLFTIAALAVAVRWGLAAMTTALLPLIVIQMLHSLTYALAHLAGMKYIQMGSEHRMVAMQALYNAIALGGSVALLTIFSGWAFEEWGGQVFWVMAAMGVAALFIRLDLPRSQLDESSIIKSEPSAQNLR